MPYSGLNNQTELQLSKISIWVRMALVWMIRKHQKSCSVSSKKHVQSRENLFDKQPLMSIEPWGMKWDVLCKTRCLAAQCFPLGF